MRKDKKQVIGDEIGDAQIKLFLDFEPADATSPSLHKLIKAYRGLRIDADQQRSRLSFPQPMKNAPDLNRPGRFSWCDHFRRSFQSRCSVPPAPG